jgi:hypothetical protein
MKLKSILLISFFTANAAQGAIVAQWNFNSNPPDISTATGTATPSTGSGTITTIGGVTNPGFNSGAGSSDTADSDNSGFQTDTYPAQSTASGTAGIRLDVSTAGFTAPAYTSLELSFDLRTSNTSSAWYRIDYTTDGGTNWTIGSATKVNNPSASGSNGDRWHNVQSITINNLAALNNADFAFRVVSVFNPNAFTQVNSNISYDAGTAYEVARNPATGSNSAYAGGTWRFDMVTVTAIPEPSAALLGGFGLLALLRRRR